MADLQSSDTAAFPPEIRQKLARNHQGGSPSTVSLELLERLYDMDYTQKIREKDATKWRFRVEPLAEIIAAEIVNASSQPRIRLQIKNPRTGTIRFSDRTFDVIIAATGYKTVANILLSAMTSSLEGGAVSVDRDYKVNFRSGQVQNGCAIWNLGCLPGASVSYIYPDRRGNG